jgi:hypothetical protein
MDRSTAQTWFTARSPRDKAIVLLDVIWLFTLVNRNMLGSADAETRLKVAWRISELNHKLSSHASNLLTDALHYPDDLIIDILFDYFEDPEWAPRMAWVWDDAIARAERNH